MKFVSVKFLWFHGTSICLAESATIDRPKVNCLHYAGGANRLGRVARPPYISLLFSRSVEEKTSRKYVLLYWVFCGWHMLKIVLGKTCFQRQNNKKTKRSVNYKLFIQASDLPSLHFLCCDVERPIKSTRKSMFWLSDFFIADIY